MANLRSLLAYAIPTVTALLGLLWFFRIRKGDEDEITDRDRIKQPDKDIDTSASGDVNLESTKSKMEVKINIQKPAAKEVNSSSRSSDENVLKQSSEESFHSAPSVPDVMVSSEIKLSSASYQEQSALQGDSLPKSHSDSATRSQSYGQFHSTRASQYTSAANTHQQKSASNKSCDLSSVEHSSESVSISTSDASWFDVNERLELARNSSAESVNRNTQSREMGKSASSCSTKMPVTSSKHSSDATLNRSSNNSVDESSMFPIHNETRLASVANVTDESHSEETFDRKSTIKSNDQVHCQSVYTNQSIYKTQSAIPNKYDDAISILKPEVTSHISDSSVECIINTESATSSKNEINDSSKNEVVESSKNEAVDSSKDEAIDFSEKEIVDSSKNEVLADLDIQVVENLGSEEKVSLENAVIDDFKSEVDVNSETDMVISTEDTAIILNSKCQVVNENWINKNNNDAHVIENWDSENNLVTENWDIGTDENDDLKSELESQSLYMKDKSENVSSLTLSSAGDGDDVSQSTASNNDGSQTPVTNAQVVSAVTGSELQSQDVSGAKPASDSTNNVDDPLSCQVSSEDKIENQVDEKTTSGHRVSPCRENMADSPGVQQTDSPGCDNNSEASNDSGRGGSVTEPLVPPQNTENHIQRYEFNFPSELCGRLIGKFGKNINYLKELSGAHISLKNNPFTPDYQICSIEGKQAEIDKALINIRKKFPRHQFPQVDLTPLGQQQPAEAPVLMPDIMQLSLPESVSVDIIISNIVDAGHIFVQQPTHPTFPSLERLNHFMMACYSQDQMVPGLPRPIEVGVICACFSGGGWYRAQIMSVVEDSDECDVKYVDYGGYSRVQAPSLKQIRSDFMTLPFQAVECYMANITPLQDEEYFSERASNILQEITESKVLQAQVVNRAEDGLPYIHIYRVGGNRVLFINRELVNHRAVRWIEILQ